MALSADWLVAVTGLGPAATAFEAAVAKALAP